MRKIQAYYIYQSATLRNIKNLTNLCETYNIKCILTGGMAVQAYIYGSSNGELHPSRSTGDLDFIISEHDFFKFKEKILPKIPAIKHREKETAIVKAVIIYPLSGPYYSISAVSELPEEDIVKVKRYKIPVERIEYLLVNKVRTFNERRKEKDLIDIYDLLKIIKSGYVKIDNKKLEDALKLYKMRKEDFVQILKNILS